MIKKMALCESRHEIAQAADGAIFPQTIEDPTDVEGLTNRAMAALEGVEHLDLYVTGMTVALVAVINACHMLCIELVLWHYDRTTEDYYPQEVRWCCY